MGTWGGRRPGAGAKPKSQRDRALSGIPAHRATVVAHPSVPVAGAASGDAGEVDAPGDLVEAERGVWAELAPFAMANRTLIPATARAFGMLCRNIVLEREMMQDIDARGGSNHRGMIQRVDAEMLRFNLAPCGKAMAADAAQPAQPANPLERFMRR